MRILVTGGAGYVGAHALLALHDAGHETVTLDDLSTGHEEQARATGTTLAVGRIEDEALVERLVREHRLDAVLHFAAKALVGESMQDPTGYLVANVSHSARLFDAAWRSGVRKFVVSSTAATYGEPVHVPIEESHPQAPINPYGASKLLMEGLLRALEPLGGRWAALRYFNAAGADAALRVGERHDHETHLIPRLLEAASDARHAPVFGTDFPTPDGTAIRDYVHVTDLADAHVRALAKLEEGSVGPINLGTGDGASVKRVVAAVARVTGRPLPIDPLPRRPGDPAVLVASNARAKAVLGWEPRHSDLDTIVSTAWRWYRRHLDVRPG